MYTKGLTIVGLAMIGGLACAQSVRITKDGRPEKIFRPVSGLDREDGHFLRQAMDANRFEIEAGKIALNKTSDGFVHEYAKEMVNDHQNAQNEAIQTAENRGLAPEGNLPEALSAKLNRLRRLSGSRFQNAYEHAQREGHEQTIAVFKREIENGHDQAVKAMAVKELPTIELHYKMLLARRTMMGPTAMKHGI